eukprot:UN13517
MKTRLMYVQINEIVVLISYGLIWDFLQLLNKHHWRTIRIYYRGTRTSINMGAFLKPKSTLIEILPSENVLIIIQLPIFGKAFDIFHTCWDELKIPPTESDWKSASFRVNNEP